MGRKVVREDARSPLSPPLLLGIRINFNILWLHLRKGWFEYFLVERERGRKEERTNRSKETQKKKKKKKKNKSIPRSYLRSLRMLGISPDGLRIRLW